MTKQNKKNKQKQNIYTHMEQTWVKSKNKTYLFTNMEEN